MSQRPFPLGLQLLPDGRLSDAKAKEVRLRDMAGYYQDQEAVAALLEANPLIYTVYDPGVPERAGEICFSVTVIEPGRVGQEYFMTRGHHHQVDAAEVYYFLEGEGYLLTESRNGETREVKVGPGSVVYIPPGWAHRTVNTGSGKLVLFAAWPGEAGHDYEAVASRGFRHRIIASPNGPVVVSTAGDDR